MIKVNKGEVEMTGVPSVLVAESICAVIGVYKILDSKDRLAMITTLMKAFENEKE